jgi:hypothetical protein
MISDPKNKDKIRKMSNHPTTALPIIYRAGERYIHLLKSKGIPS